MNKLSINIINLILLLGLSTAVQATPANSAQNSENNAEKSGAVVVPQFLGFDWAWAAAKKRKEAKKKATKKAVAKKKLQDRAEREYDHRHSPSKYK
jgi:hypothetical protein